MTPVTAIRGSIVTPPVGRAPRDGASTSAAPETASSRALIALQPIASGDAGSQTRPQAGFLAHLIATDRKLPQTRERRRAEPAEAIAAYAATGTATPGRTGRRLYRVT
jgi:hypothetical protein